MTGQEQAETADRAETAGRRPLTRLRLLPVSFLVLGVLLSGALGTFALSHRMVAEQQDRLLAERANEVRALLDNSIDSIESSLQVLGPIGASSGPGAQALFEQSAQPLLRADPKAIGVAREDAGDLTVTVEVGDGPETGAQLTGQRAELGTRALGLSEPRLVSDVITEEGNSILVLAMATRGARAVAYQEQVLSRQAAPSAPDSPFRDLQVSLYASPDPDPQRLVVTTEAEPLSGRVEEVPFSVGADRWLMTVGAKGPLTGSLTRTVPWLLLGAGLLMALLATAVVETTGRRRAYAMERVAERTQDLQVALEELGGTRAFLQRLLTAGPVLVLRVAVPDRQVSYVSPNIGRLFGYTEEAALTPDFVGEMSHPDDKGGVDAALVAVEGGASRRAIEFRLRCGDGSFRWTSAVLAPETGSDDKIAAVLAYILDIEGRREAEDAQRAAQEAAEAANRSKSEFLSRMSHELRTPLNAVIGFGQLLEIDELDEDQREAVDHILKGGRHLLSLINEVLDISRIEAGQLSLSPEPVLAAELIQETVDLIRPLAGQRGIRLAVDGTGVCDVYVFADRQRVKQVFLNLLSNAVKYNRSMGTVALSCHRHSATRLRIDVADTGMGIPAERLGMLFTPFERLGAEQTGEEGTGIGLALSKTLTEAMGGTLEVSSTLGKGSTFTVELPRVEGPVERYERFNGESRPAPVPTRAHQVVLHIEDNLANVTLVERILAQRPGLEVIAAMQGRLGLELAHQHRPALVLLDLHLPDIGGEQVLQRLRDDPATASIPVVIVSADATPGQVQRLLNAGAVAYLTKPIDVPELLRILDERGSTP